MIKFVLAQLSPRLALTNLQSVELGLALGALVTLAGVWLQWQLPRRRMSAEEALKDGKLSEVDANRQIRLHAVAAPTLTVCGALGMLAALLGWLE